jgi:hypothetical protein
MKQKISVCCALLVAISISATATAAPQKRERPHRPSLVEVIEHRVMGVVAVVEGKAKATMEAKVRAAMEAKAKAAMAKRNASMEGLPCPYNNDRPAFRSLSIDAPSSPDENRCR